MPRLLACAAALLAVTLVHAEDTYTLKFYESKQGDVLKATQDRKMEGKMTLTSGGKVDEVPLKQGEASAYTHEVLAKKPGDKLSTKVQRTYEKWERTDEKGTTTKSALVGKTVVAEYPKDGKGKATFTVDGKPPTDEQAAELEGEFKVGDDGGPDFKSVPGLLPARPLKVGDAWAINADDLTKAFGERMKGTKFDVKKSSFTGKLVKAATRDGVTTGSLAFDLKFVITEFTIGTEAVPADAGSAVVFTVRFDDLVLDGSAPGEKMEVTTKVVYNGKPKDGGAFGMNVTYTITSSEEAVAKKK
jgi:hypothetical protein